MQNEAKYKVGDIVKLTYSDSNPRFHHIYYVRILFIEDRLHRNPFIKGATLYCNYSNSHLVNKDDSAFYAYDKIEKMDEDEVMIELL